MRQLVDREGSSHALIVDMPSTGSLLAARDAEIERDYAEHRSPVIAMLRAAFPRLDDLDEIYQEAWAELLALEARGERVQHRRALLKKIAWRRAADVTKRRRPDVLDPSSAALAQATDVELSPDEQAQLRLDGDALRLIVESLDEQQATVLKLRFDQHLSAGEVQDRLGIGEKRFEAIITKAYKQHSWRSTMPERRAGLAANGASCWLASSASRQRASAAELRRWSTATPRAGRCFMRCGPTSTTSRRSCRCRCSCRRRTACGARARFRSGSMSCSLPAVISRRSCPGAVFPRPARSSRRV